MIVKDSIERRKIGKNHILEVFMLLSIIYLVLMHSSVEQSMIDISLEIFLAISFVSTAFFRKHLFGINREGLLNPKELDCETMDSEWCREVCFELKELLSDLEYSGALRSKKGIAWRVGGYTAGIGGILLALITSAGVIAALGIMLCLPSVLDWMKDDPEYWKHWQERAKSIRGRLSKFSNECVEKNA